MGQLVELITKYHVLTAFWMTIKLTAVAALGSLIIGTIVAVCRVSPVGVLRWFGAAYVNVIRNTPLTLIVFFFAFGVLNTLNISLTDPHSPTSIADNNFRWGVVALSVYHASFVAEALAAVSTPSRRDRRRRPARSGCPSSRRRPRSSCRRHSAARSRRSATPLSP